MTFSCFYEVPSEVFTLSQFVTFLLNMNHLIITTQSMETRNHLFFSCSYSSQIWQKLVKGLLQLRYTEEWEDIFNLLLDSRQKSVRLFLLRYTFQATAHTIWWERNKRMHWEEQHPYSLLIKTIDKTDEQIIYH